ncbi:MAG TPA: LysR substrate-binding domain-containing protein [Acidimicrobiales bacterium]|jgi:DNA-binding transcriptional LysR family regulator
MELRQLRYALAVVDHGTFTAAAAACHVAQPSLSEAVRNLERELGSPLFNRIGRRVVLTAAGAAFARAAREALRAVDAVRAEVDSVAGLLAGHLDLVALPTLAVDPVAPLVGAFRSTHPGVTVRLAHPDTPAELVHAILTGDSEVGINETLPSHPGLTSHPLPRQEIVAVLPPGSPPRRRLDVRTLAGVPLVTQPPGTSTRSMLDAAVASVGLTPVLAVETDLREAIVPLVLVGAGAAVLPRPMAAVAAEQGAVVASLVPRLWRELSLIRRQDGLSPAARAFVEIAAATQ